MLDLDGYADLERIGHGGLGDVYRATRMSTGGTVAIKVLRDVSDESVAWHRTRRELTALVSLGGHAHVVRLLEVLEHTPGLVMEYAPGGSVAQLLDRRELTVGEVVLVGRHTASALVAAHEQGIVHRDVKPQNLLVDAFGQVKLCDFGIASLARTEEFRTRTSAISMRYASPEDLEEDAEVGPPADVYSLGATLLHLAHGAPPTLKERLAPWTPPPTDDPDLAGLDEILAACLQPAPADRPSAAEVLERLEALDWRLTDRRRALTVDDHVDLHTAHPDRPDPDEARAPLDPPPDARAEDRIDRWVDGWADGASEAALDEWAHDATVYRTGRGPTPPPRPDPPRRRGRLVPAVAGLAVAAAIVVVVLVWPSDEAEAPTRSTVATSTIDSTVASSAPESADVTLVERPDGLVDLAEVVWPLGSIGECLVQAPDVDRLQAVDCDEPHDLQRYAVGALEEGTTSPDEPDDAELELAVADLCLAAAPDDWPLPEMQVAQTNPSAATWADGDRGYQCLVGVPGRRLVGSALE